VGTARRGRSVIEQELAAVLLDDLLHDREAKTGALVALCRDIGLEQAGAIVLGESRPVVDDVYC
jgi:hypothetical protein